MFKIYNKNIFSWLRPLFFMVIVWASARAVGFEFGLMSPLGIGVLLLTIGALVFEFALSVDIGVKSFNRDLLFALTNVVIGSSLITWMLVARGGIAFTDILILVCILVDAWLGTTNSFRTALRNWSGQVNQGQSEGGNSQ